MRSIEAAGNPRPPKPRQRRRHVAPLPTRDGVSPSWVALPPGAWPSVAAFLIERFTLVAPHDWLARMQAGEVVDGDGAPITPQRPYKAGLMVWYYRALADETPIPFAETLLFQDAHLVAADKPHFLPVLPTGKYVQESLLVRLKRRLGIDTLSPVHRIDRQTAGVVLFSVQPAERDRYQTLFRERSVRKVYEAIVPWPDAGRVLPPLYRSRLVQDANFLRTSEVAGEPNAETHIELLAARNGYAHLRLMPVSGRKHQLRVHCAALGLPIVHDDFYPRLLPEGADDHARPLQLLARSVAFTDPVTGQARHFESARRLDIDAVVAPLAT